jgi:hypothetical protein
MRLDSQAIRQLPLSIRRREAKRLKIETRAPPPSPEDSPPTVHYGQDRVISNLETIEEEEPTRKERLRLFLANPRGMTPPAPPSNMALDTASSPSTTMITTTATGSNRVTRSRARARKRAEEKAQDQAWASYQSKIIWCELGHNVIKAMATDPPCPQEEQDRLYALNMDLHQTLATITARFPYPQTYLPHEPYPQFFKNPQAVRINTQAGPSRRPRSNTDTRPAHVKARSQVRNPTKSGLA